MMYTTLQVPIGKLRPLWQRAGYVVLAASTKTIYSFLP